MSEFVKPTRVEIDVTNEIKTLFGAKLIKDLHENEAICPVCKGTGIRVEQNRYGLSDDPDKQSGHFPYFRQSFSFCHNCYNGIVRYCADCGRQLPRGRLKCDCDAEIQRRLSEEVRKEAEELKAATKHDYTTLGTKFQMCCSPYYSHNDGYFSDWEEFFDDWYDTQDEDAPKPEFVWGTEETEMYFDADGIVSSACEDLYEDAIDDIGKEAIVEMQSFLDTWTQKYGRTAYYEDHKNAVKIPWDLYKG